MRPPILPEKSILTIVTSGPLVSGLRVRERIWDLAQRVLCRNFLPVRRILAAEGSLESRDSILDLGCGSGWLFEHYRPRNYLGIDSNAAMIEWNRARFGDRFENADVASLQTGHRKFDRIFSIGLLHHLNDKAVVALASQIPRLLTPRGHYLVIEAVPNAMRRQWLGRMLRALDDGHHIRPLEGYVNLLGRHLRISKQYVSHTWPLDYAVIVAK